MQSNTTKQYKYNTIIMFSVLTMFSVEQFHQGIDWAQWSFWTLIYCQWSHVQSLHTFFIIPVNHVDKKSTCIVLCWPSHGGGGVISCLHNNNDERGLSWWLISHYLSLLYFCFSGNKTWFLYNFILFFSLLLR